MSEIFIISIDGPAASGKSTVSRLLAQKLEASWLSTGIFYRGLAFLVKEFDLNPLDISEVLSVLKTVDWRVEMQAQETSFYFKGNNHTLDLKGEEVGGVASLLAANGEVRLALLEEQRKMKFMAKIFLIAEGRDCSTVVFPESKLKVFIEANLEDRAKRRSLETGSSEELVKTQQKQRDRQDSLREIAPLKIHKQAICINSSMYSAMEIVDDLYAKVQNFLNV